MMKRQSESDICEDWPEIPIDNFWPRSDLVIEYPQLRKIDWVSYIWKFVIEYTHLRMIGWISFMRIWWLNIWESLIEYPKKYENLSLNILIWWLIEYPIWEFYIEYPHLRTIDWISYMRIFHWIPSSENILHKKLSLNILIWEWLFEYPIWEFSHWIASFKNDCLNILTENFLLNILIWEWSFEYPI